MNLAIFTLVILVAVCNGCFRGLCETPNPPNHCLKRRAVQDNTEVLCQLEYNLFSVCEEDGLIGLTEAELTHCVWDEAAQYSDFGTSSQIVEFNKIFELLDINTDGTVTMDEFTETVVEGAEEVFNICDDADDGLTLGEAKICKNKYGLPMPDSLVHLIFSQFDCSDNSKIMLKDILEKFHQCV